MASRTLDSIRVPVRVLEALQSQGLKKVRMMIQGERFDGQYKGDRVHYVLESFRTNPRCGSFTCCNTPWQVEKRTVTTITMLSFYHDKLWIALRCPTIVCQIRHHPKVLDQATYAENTQQHRQEFVTPASSSPQPDDFVEEKNGKYLGC